MRTNISNNVMLIVGILLIIVGISIPVFSAEPKNLPNVDTTRRSIEDVRIQFAINTARGFAKGLELNGREITCEEWSRAYKIAYDRGPKIFAKVNEAGHWEEYTAQMFDPDVRVFDEKTLKTKKLSEVIDYATQQLKVVERKYPKLYGWLIKDTAIRAEMQALIREMIGVARG